MYMMKITKDGQMLAVKHYIHFENAMADIADHTAFDYIPDDIINAMGEWGNPKISCHGIENETGIADDFEFKYPCGVLIYVGKILIEDEKSVNREV